MSRDVTGAALLASGIWLGLAVAALAPARAPANDIWVVTASQKIASRPVLVRTARPPASMPREDADEGSRGGLPEI